VHQFQTEFNFGSFESFPDPVPRKPVQFDVLSGIPIYARGLERIFVPKDHFPNLKGFGCLHWKESGMHEGFQYYYHSDGHYREFAPVSVHWKVRGTLRVPLLGVIPSKKTFVFLRKSWKKGESLSN